ncbi:MAG: 1-deoxy-D-xylulose-5-phosphate synthase [Gammaproteobacteria bacterium]|jgi:1-deoxy-D-xylulose-5-phosphate synthase|uniref:1-deoxy-D-xylulose-5-phosphate synthase n=5 Tax=OM182 clade TaxID=745002 RepID=A0A0R2TD42_9GAMM|nr:MAG: 1-deoxy-D-xylulose-5-phosphate synthase [OM182 bacterium BACL3 MAG-120619-bin3]KRO85145.1 MAG: 1-deoxy-D-xylulose-5-phosphate synthase [OM182 bacterium BACL3 MAG-120920-bin41]KRP30200.1 MAG: 1-deoxy-D-xylulose-5-phosphate synthase [OM182 bacterium BACL3 MAG-120924-bin41]KRP38715.1 MAG: 1-deoxy-D-xylulose-5-phosphate synthase [OM182 bacterium BACL3 MAG-120531-bin86]MBT3522173.1 1-deoxy-D-xylulose-5-phosphate synthase [Gammaproteobacteria bacterium]MDP4660710.1 1-deoxy-D-xylulose-5-phosp
MLDAIPTERPITPLLDSIDETEKLRELDVDQLDTLARELREFLLYSVGKTGGHFGAGLGVVELTIALHYVFNTPHDSLVWDVGHQAYPHKILTGRRERMLTMRQPNGLAAFPTRSESDYDTFGVGHSSTSISAALGMMAAKRQQGRAKDSHTIAIIGDGAMTAGMAFEALNHAGALDDNVLVILNDNNMSISNNVGGLSSYFARMWASKPYNFIRSGSKRVLSKLPPALKAVHRAEEYMKGMVSPGTLFEEIGFNYIGLVDGHDTEELVEILSNIKTLRGPQLLHVVTQKGKGYTESENDPFGMHALSKITPASAAPAATAPSPTYSQVFGDWLCDMADADDRAVGITPAMGEGSGMREFAERFPNRFFDVAIAEQHAVTFAAGMACEGAKPVVAIYSTFLQRAYDQLIHDVALQNLDVLFAIDRAGLVGEDGPTHAGSFDISYLRCIPNMVVMTPSDEAETRLMLSTGYQHKGPAAVRYPRGKGPGAALSGSLDTLVIGKGIIRRKGENVALLAFGSLTAAALAAAETLDATVADMRFVKPLDAELIAELASTHDLLVTVEENAIMGGAGSAVCEHLAATNYKTSILNLGLSDTFIEHGKVPQMLAGEGLDAEGIVRAIRARLAG